MCDCCQYCYDNDSKSDLPKPKNECQKELLHDASKVIEYYKWVEYIANKSLGVISLFADNMIDDAFPIEPSKGMWKGLIERASDNRIEFEDALNKAISLIGDRLKIQNPAEEARFDCKHLE